MTDDARPVDELLAEYVDDADPVHRVLHAADKRIEGKADAAAALARKAFDEASEAKLIANAFSVEMSSIQAAMVAHVDRSSAKTDARITKLSKRSGNQERLLRSVARTMKTNATDRKHQLQVMGLRIPLFNALIGGFVAVVTALIMAWATTPRAVALPVPVAAPR
ncbi:MAG: hypothetical protein JWM74_1800 [Myxococcaceae bacterium]|nr:hypothetical protein [Myxococcaceae bacterium]